jgi:hypothetical protein
MTFAIAVLLFLAGLAAIVWGIVQAILFYVAREWYDRHVAGSIRDMGRDEVEKLIGQVRSAFVRRHILERLKNYGGSYAAGFVRGMITRYGRIGLLVAALGLAMIVAAFNVGALMRWAGAGTG